jgi:hypothetical protein
MKGKGQRKYKGNREEIDNRPQENESPAVEFLSAPIVL